MIKIFQASACLSKVNYSVLFGIVSLLLLCYYYYCYYCITWYCVIDQSLPFIVYELKDVIPAKLLPSQAH